MAPTQEVRFHTSGSEKLIRQRTGRGGAALVAILLLSIGAVGAALVTQHRFGMDPCPWCVLQRLIYCAIAVAALLGLVWRRTGTVLALLLALCGAAAALWQHFVAAASPSCNLTLADRIMNALKLPTLLPEVFEPRASCADAAVSLFGVAYDLWSLALFTFLAVLAIVALAATRQRRAPVRSPARREPT